MTNKRFTKINAIVLKKSQIPVGTKPPVDKKLQKKIAKLVKAEKAALKKEKRNVENKLVKVYSDKFAALEKELMTLQRKYDLVQDVRVCELEREFCPECHDDEPFCDDCAAHAEEIALECAQVPSCEECPHYIERKE